MPREQVLELVSGTLMSAMNNGGRAARAGDPQRLMRRRARRVAAATASVLAIGALASGQAARAAVPTGYNPNNLPVASCFWTGPFTNVDPRTNQGFPGQEITYWGAKFATPPGAVRDPARQVHPRALPVADRLRQQRDRDEHRLGLPDAPGQGLDQPVRQGPPPRSARSATTRSRVLGSARSPAAGAQHPLRPARSERQLLPGHPLPGLRPRQGTGPRRGRAPPHARAATGRRQRPEGPGDVRRAQLESLLPIARTCRSPIYQSYVNWPGKDPATNPATPDFSFEKFFSLNYALSAYKTPAEHAAADYTPGRHLLQQPRRPLHGRQLQLRLRAGAGRPRQVARRRPVPMPARSGWAAGQLREWDMCVEESACGHRHLQVPLRRAVPAAEETPLRDRRRARAATGLENATQAVRCRLAACRPGRRRRRPTRRRHRWCRGT